MTSLGVRDAESYAEWFAVLADPTRVRLLHTLSTSPTGAMRIGDLAGALGISQSTCSHHVELLRKVGFVVVDKVGTAEHGVGECRLLHRPAPRRRCRDGHPVVRALLPEDLSADVSTRPVTDGDMETILTIYAEGLATRNATFETKVPTARQLRQRWLPEMAWVAELEGRVVGWTAVTATSARECYAGVGETSVYVAEGARSRGVGKALLFTQVTEADKAGLWTLQTSIFPENRASLALHHSAGYRTLAVRTRIAQLDGVWRDTVLLERRSEVI